MAKRRILGVDVGRESLKLALVSEGRVEKAAVASMPNNLVKEGRVVSVETLGELIRSTMKEAGIRANAAAYVLSSEAVYLHNTVMPRMTEEQLMYNIPYELEDYITDELKNYVFDYAMLSRPEELAADESAGMELLVAAVPIRVIDEVRDLLYQAGLKLVKCAPAESAYVSLIRRLEELHQGYGEYSILDLGSSAIRLLMFNGDRHMATRALDIGLADLDRTIADAYSVDIHLAHTYLITDYDGCQRKEPCLNAYNSIAVELMRAMNFYRFSNPDSRVEDLWICGGGAVIEPLREAISATLDMRIHFAEELLPEGVPPEAAHTMVQAVGITMD